MAPMARRTLRDLAAENAVLISTIERIRDELDAFLSDSDEDQREDEDDDQGEADEK
jgi:hypothetical protein